MPNSVVAVLPHFLASASQLRDILLAVAGPTQEAHCSIVVVANNPENEAFTSVEGIPGVKILKPGLNLGYVGALELVRRHTPAQYLWVLQEDLVPLPGCLDRLTEALDTTRTGGIVAAVSPVEVDNEGNLLVQPRTAHYNVETGHYRPSTQAEIQQLSKSICSGNGPEYAFIAFAGTLIRCDVLEEIGGFDVYLWPLALVDVTTSISLQRLGYSIQIIEQARIIHDRSESQHFPRFHHWTTIAHQRNTRRVKERFAYGSLDDDRRIPDIPMDILYPVARSMSEFMFEYSEWVHNTSWRALAWRAKRWVRLLKNSLG